MSIEKYLERKLREEIKNRGGWALKFHCLSFTGMPDRMVLMPGGKIWFVELKDRGVKPSSRQRLVHGQLTARGFRVRVVDSPEALSALMGEIETEVLC